MDWRSMSKKTARGDLWSDEELMTAIDSYLYLMSLERSCIDYSLTEITTFLLSGPLKNRNDASIRYRMRNISDVLKKLDWPILSIYSPAPQVGAGVRERIEAILISRSQQLTQIKKISQSSIKSEPLKSVSEKLNRLYKKLEEFGDQRPGHIGHNNPPEPIDDNPFTLQEINSAKESIQAIKDEINTLRPDNKKVEVKKNIVLRLGLKLAIWIGKRVTDFSKATAIAAGTAVGAWAVGLGPQILGTLHSLTSFMKALG